MNRDNMVSSTSSELYTYDTENRLSSFKRGTLDSSRMTITTPHTTESESWSLDALDNWGSETTNGTATSKSHNDANELTSKGGTNLTYDNNGNMLADDAGNTYTYDAWNRLVSENRNDKPPTFPLSWSLLAGTALELVNLRTVE